MKPAPFEYVLPKSLDEVVSALASEEEARVLAGGQSLVPMMNLRLARPTLLVDCNHVSELAEVTLSGDAVEIGAMCRHRRIESDPDIAAAVPLLAEAASLVGYPQIRNRASLGGSLAHADPASELSAACVVLGATVNTRSATGSRPILISEFFEGFFSTGLQVGEVIVSVTIPRANGNWGYAFREFAPRHGDFALAGIAVAVERVDGVIGGVRMAGCGLGSTVIELTPAVATLSGAKPDEGRLQAVAAEVTALVRPVDDNHASSSYRTELAQVLAVEALRAAWARTESGAAA